MKTTCPGHQHQPTNQTFSDVPSCLCLNFPVVGTLLRGTACRKTVCALGSPFGPTQTLACVGTERNASNEKHKFASDKEETHAQKIEHKLSKENKLLNLDHRMEPMSQNVDIFGCLHVGVKRFETVTTGKEIPCADSARCTRIVSK